MIFYKNWSTLAVINIKPLNTNKHTMEKLVTKFQMRKIYETKSNFWKLPKRFIEGFSIKTRLFSDEKDEMSFYHREKIWEAKTIKV